jgi:hypothetical protein
MKKGVQLVPLSDRINNYSGEIAIRQLQNYKLTNNDIIKLMSLRKELADRPYEKNIIELIKSAYDGLGGHNVEDLSSIFCSELIAETYQTINLLSENKPSNEYTPADFSEKRNLKLLKGNLSPEIILKTE